MHEPLANQQVPAYILNVEGLTPCGVLRQHGFALADALQDDGEWLSITLSERARGPAGDTVFDPMAGMSIAQMRPSPRAAHAQLSLSVARHQACQAYSKVRTTLTVLSTADFSM